MPSLSQSPMLQALGYAIAHSLWQMAMVWIVYVLLNSLFKFKSENKYRIAVAAQVVGFAWFIGTLQFYYAQCSQALKVAEALYLQSGDHNSIVFATGKSSLLSFFIKAEQVLPYLSVAYLLLLGFLTIRWFRAYRYTQIVRLNGLHKIDVDWKLFVNKVSAQLGIKQKVRIYLSELVQSPVTIGFLKPVILIPIASITHLTAQQLEAVILHELAHIRRHDYLLNIVLSIVDLALFFNPFTRLITKSVSKERENSCDDWVLQYQYNPAMYAEALLRIAVLQKTPAMAMYAVKTKSELASRVQRMISRKDRGFSYRHQLVALLLMTGILTSIAWYDPTALKAQDIKPTAENRAVVLEPLAIKIDNPLFNPLSFLNGPLKEEVKKNVASTQRQMRKIRRDAELATREIQLPDVMAPVAIENLKDLERNLNTTVNRQTKRTWLTAVPAVNMKLAQADWFNTQEQFQFDTIRFNNAFAFSGKIEKWTAFADELKASQKAIEDALKKGKITTAAAKKMQAQLAEAFKNLNDAKTQQAYYGFAPATNGNTFFFRSDEEENDNQKEKTATEEKRRTGQRERIAPTRIKRIYVDSLKQKLVARTLPSLPQAGTQLHGYMALASGTNTYFVDKDQQATTVYGYVHTPKTAVLKAGAAGKGEATTTYNYVLSENELVDECDKANNTDRHRTNIATVPGKGKVANGKCTKTATKKGNCVQVIINPPPPETEPLIFNVEVQ